VTLGYSRGLLATLAGAGTRALIGSIISSAAYGRWSPDRRRSGCSQLNFSTVKKGSKIVSAGGS
jgi:hypothetical protein